MSLGSSRRFLKKLLINHGVIRKNWADLSLLQYCHDREDLELLLVLWWNWGTSKRWLTTRLHDYHLARMTTWNDEHIYAVRGGYGNRDIEHMTQRRHKVPSLLGFLATTRLATLHPGPNTIRHKRQRASSLPLAQLSIPIESRLALPLVDQVCRDRWYAPVMEQPRRSTSPCLLQKGCGGRVRRREKSAAVGMAKPDRDLRHLTESPGPRVICASDGNGVYTCLARLDTCGHRRRGGWRCRGIPAEGDGVSDLVGLQR